MRVFYIFTLLGSLLLAGCASNPMAPVADQAVQAPSPDMAQVVFMRDAYTGKAIVSSLYDVTDGQTRFIGVMANGTKIAHPTTPGKHTFMVVSEAADFMEADLVAGKTYYALVTPRMGLWKARFSLWPISNEPDAAHSLKSNNFKDWVEDTDLVTNSPKSLAWYQRVKASVEKKRAEYWPVWQEKSAEAIAERTLKPTDGL
ncbi:MULTISPECIES: hypothetical protein [Pseudomonas]|jgi:hypothetical protein|uniref:hypothetical protein n=1 Tax=Pseudomonas TaxID=286 RepID=UPI000B4D3B95|nr:MULTISPECIES: hypothetical protein [Pseudomonas]AOA05466.1 hypothetical protein BFC21_06595 [Pseudomonas sp. TMW 2.1634]ASC85613.1 hypothetical protein CDA60_03960 [Pseudomonas fragi]